MIRYIKKLSPGQNYLGFISMESTFLKRRASLKVKRSFATRSSIRLHHLSSLRSSGVRKLLKETKCCWSAELLATRSLMSGKCVCFSKVTRYHHLLIGKTTEERYQWTCLEVISHIRAVYHAVVHKHME